MGEPQGRPGRVRKISPPPGFDPWNARVDVGLRAFLRVHSNITRYMLIEVYYEDTVNQSEMYILYVIHYFLQVFGF